MHVLPKGFHRIRHYGLLANGNRAANIARARELLFVSTASEQADQAEGAKAEKPEAPDRTCPCCGGRMIIIEVFAKGCEPKHQPNPEAIDRS